MTYDQGVDDFLQGIDFALQACHCNFECAQIAFCVHGSPFAGLLCRRFQLIATGEPPFGRCAMLKMMSLFFFGITIGSMIESARDYTIPVAVLAFMSGLILGDELCAWFRRQRYGWAS